MRGWEKNQTWFEKVETKTKLTNSLKYHGNIDYLSSKLLILYYNKEREKEKNR